MPEELDLGGNGFTDMLLTSDLIEQEHAETHVKKPKGMHKPLLYKQERRGKGDRDVTTLMVAAEHGSAGSVRRLLQENAEVNARDSQGWTALHYAAWQGECEICTTLLNGRADPAIKDMAGRTPLQISAVGEENITQILNTTKV